MQQQKERVLFYNITPVQYLRNASVVVDKLCNGATVINTGTTVMTANGIPLNPGVVGVRNGESFTFGGNRGEVFAGRIDLAFVGGTGSCFLIQKIYIPELTNREILI
jgi:hypothetical protein